MNGYGTASLSCMALTGALVVSIIILKWVSLEMQIDKDKLSQTLEQIAYFTGIAALTLGFFHVHED